jgi:hypothetical protein
VRLFVDAPAWGYTDFNSIDRDGLLTISRSRLTGFEPRVGDEIIAMDRDENQCRAVVVKEADRYLKARADWTSWKDSPLYVAQARVSTGQFVSAPRYSVEWADSLATT